MMLSVNELCVSECVCLCLSLSVFIRIHVCLSILICGSVMMMNVCGSRGMGGEVRRGNYCPVLHSRTLPQAEGS